MESIFGSELGIRHRFKGPTLPYVITANVAYRMKVLKEVGFFDETFFSGGDTDLSWRIVKKGYDIVYEPQAIVHHYPRENLHSFFKQYYKYGLGYARLCYKHEIRKDQTSELTLLLKNELTVLASFPYRIAKGLVNKKDRNSISIMTPVFGGISLFASTAGFIRGYKILTFSRIGSRGSQAGGLQRPVTTAPVCRNHLKYGA